MDTTKIRHILIAAHMSVTQVDKTFRNHATLNFNHLHLQLS